MAAILAATDVTVTFPDTKAKCLGRHGKIRRGTIALGDASLKLGTAGTVAIAKEKFGFHTEIFNVQIVEGAGSGYKFEYDASAELLYVKHYDYSLSTDGVAVAAASVAIAAHTLEAIASGY